MPGDSLKIHPVRKDSPLPIQKEVPPKAITVQEIPPKDEYYRIGKLKLTEGQLGLIFSIIGILISLSALYALLYKKIKAYVKPCVILTAFDEESDNVEADAPYFIPNDIQIHNFFNKDITGDKLLHSDTSITFLLREIVSDTKAQYFITAPTGIGKTTFLKNLFLSYKDYSSWKNCKYTVLLGKMYDENTVSKLKGLIKDKKEDNTVLLLDALDELAVYGSENGLKPAEYKKKFITKWEEQKEILGAFHKVIITVRQQFLEQEQVDALQLYSSNSLYHVHLQPFSFSQINTYIEKRYTDEGPVKQAIKDLIVKAEAENRKHPDTKDWEFLKTPLLLKYLPDIAKAIVFEKETIRGNYAVYKVITDKWIEREAMEKKYKSEASGYRVDLQEFSENLAYHIAQGNDKSTIPLSELVKFERTQNASLITSGLSDRSLLVKTKRQTIVGRKSITTEHFHFVHTSFLEYFLHCMLKKK